MLDDEGLMEVPGLLSRWVRLAGGARAHYVTSGERGPAVVLLHGGAIGASGSAGYPFMAPFLGAHGFRVYCPDFPAFGLTEDPLGHYRPGFAGHVEFLHDFVDALCLDTFCLAGNSMGATNTVLYLLADPDRVVRFALIAGSIGDITSARVVDLDADGSAKAQPPWRGFDGTEATMRRMIESVVYDRTNVSDDLVAMRTFAANRTIEQYRAHLAASIAVTNGYADSTTAASLRTRGRLDEVTVPGIYLWGVHDVVFTMDEAHAQEDALPNVQFFYPERTGHQGQTDRPELFNQVILEFFRDGTISEATALEAGVSQRRPLVDGIVSASTAARRA